MSMRAQITFQDKFTRVSWPFIGLLCLICFIGFAALYSAAGGSLQPWALKQMVRFLMAFVCMFALIFVDIRQVFKYSYIFYFISLTMLVYVEVFGHVGMGAQRWIDLKIMKVQPSELMKIAVVLALARYFHGLDLDEIRQLRNLIKPLLIIFVPVILVLKQPDLGTAIMIMSAGIAILFFAGVQMWIFIVGLVGAIAAVPIGWHFLRQYQKDRIMIFLDPEKDPLGAGYHIMQSKIALGSGGIFGKGFLNGSQSHLNFLPEKQTDFIFTMMAEEIGLIGCIVLLFLYSAVTAYSFTIGVNAGNQYGRLLCLGITTNFFLYFFINMAMVMGLLPVVGVPLPLISYGGTAMLSVLMGFGLVQNIHVYRDVRMTRRGAVL